MVDRLFLTTSIRLELKIFIELPTDHLLSDSVPNFGPLVSRWEINRFENCWYESVRILEVLKPLFRQFLNWFSSQRDMSGPILGDLSNNRWSGGTSMSPLLLAAAVDNYRFVLKEKFSTLSQIQDMVISLHQFFLSNQIEKSYQNVFEMFIYLFKWIIKRKPKRVK